MEKIIKSLCDRTDYKANKNVFKLGVSIFLKKNQEYASVSIVGDEGISPTTSILLVSQIRNQIDNDAVMKSHYTRFNYVNSVRVIFDQWNVQKQQNSIHPKPKKQVSIQRINLMKSKCLEYQNVSSRQVGLGQNIILSLEMGWIWVDNFSTH